MINFHPCINVRYLMSLAIRSPQEVNFSNGHLLTRLNFVRLCVLYKSRYNAKTESEKAILSEQIKALAQVILKTYNQEKARGTLFRQQPVIRQKTRPDSPYPKEHFGFRKIQCAKMETNVPSSLKC